MLIGSKEGKADWIQGGCLIQDARLLLNTLPGLFIMYIENPSNMVAHNLAKNNLSLASDIYDLKMIPQCI